MSRRWSKEEPAQALMGTWSAQGFGKEIISMDSGGEKGSWQTPDEKGTFTFVGCVGEEKYTYTLKVKPARGAEFKSTWIITTGAKPLDDTLEITWPVSAVAKFAPMDTKYRRSALAPTELESDEGCGCACF